MTLENEEVKTRVNDGTVAQDGCTSAPSTTKINEIVQYSIVKINMTHPYCIVVHRPLHRPVSYCTHPDSRGILCS